MGEIYFILFHLELYVPYSLLLPRLLVPHVAPRLALVLDPRLRVKVVQLHLARRQRLLILVHLPQHLVHLAIAFEFEKHFVHLLYRLLTREGDLLLGESIDYSSLNELLLEQAGKHFLLILQLFLLH